MLGIAGSRSFESTRRSGRQPASPHSCAKRSRPNENLPAQQWIDPNTRRSLSVETRRIMDKAMPLGAVAVIHDLTAEENLREKQELVDRAAFWTDLAASMSHEIRNPLVAIKTFAQLLPERFDDADFRKDFNEIVVQEIDRLDKIITQINNFAHPLGAGYETDRRSCFSQKGDRDRARNGLIRTAWRSTPHCRTTFRKCWGTKRP